MNSRWASLLLGLLLLASLSACSDSQEAAPSDEDGAWDEYLLWCSEASLEELPGDEDQTYGEVSTFYAEGIERMKAASPPAEVADWHNKVLDAIEAIKAWFDARPRDEIVDPFEAFEVFSNSEILSLFEEAGEEFNALSADTRERLAAAGCAGDADSEPTDGGEANTPQPDSTASADSGRTSTDQAFMPKCEPRSSYEPALIALYNATDGQNWKDNTNWLSDAPLGDWAGVSANRITVNGRVTGECVTQLWLSGNRLKGELPAEMGSLLSLAELDLSNNQLSGEIPAQLGSLLNLQLLDLSDNQLSGEIPAQLGSLLNLQLLDLSDNQLSGEIPAQLGGLPTLQRLDLSDNQLSGEIPAELGNIPTLYLDGNRLTGRVLRPGGANPQYAWEGSTIRVNWDAVDGADYYKVYYNAHFDSSCDLDSDGRLSFCEELATGVTGTTYVHTNPSLSENYYWVVSCNSGGCSDIDSKNPAVPAEAIPTAPANARYAVEGSTIRVSWSPVAGADYYNIYHDGSSDSRCEIDRDGRASFCEELARNVEGTSFVHTAPDSRDNYYWIVACNRGGCSEIDSENPVKAPGTSSTQATNMPTATRAPTQTPAPSDTPTPEPTPTRTDGFGHAHTGTYAHSDPRAVDHAHTGTHTDSYADTIDSTHRDHSLRPCQCSLRP